MEILLVQSDRQAPDALQAELVRQGHDVIVTDDMAAVKPADGAPCGRIVVLGVDGPAGSDPTWRERLREARRLLGGEVWAVTASTDAADHAALLEAGADDVLVEPIEPRLLAARLGAAGRRAVREASGMPGDEDAQRRWQQAHDELVAVYVGVADGILVADARTRRFVRTNPAMCRLTGYPEDELLRLTVGDLHPAESASWIDEQFRGIVSDRAARAETMPVLRKDGSVVHCDVWANHMCFRGRPSIVGFFRDVTARRQAEQALAKSEARFRAVFEGAASGGVLVDLDGRIVECNTAFAGMLGYVPAELSGRRAVDLTHPDDRDEGTRRFQEYIERGQGVLRFEKRLLHREGGAVWARFNVSLLPELDNKPGVLIITVEDVTDRKLAEQALRESEAMLRTLIENIPDLVAMVDADWNIHYINQGAGPLGPKDLVGANGLTYASAMHREQCVEAMRQALETGKARVFDAQDRFGGWWSARLVPVFEEGAIRNIMLICVDVSQRRAAEESVRKEQELLRRLLDLFERDRELVAFEIHDGFSQQLTGALLNFEAVDQLRRTDPDQADAAFRNGLGLLRESIEEARRLVRGLRPPVLDQFGIVPAIEHLLEDHPDVLGPKIEFLSGLKPGRLARPLETSLFRMVQELLSNIRRHSQADHARIELVQDKQSVRLTVMDSGVGFDPDAVGADHFGLRGIRERARLLGGRAEIESTLAQGTRIHVVLPLVVAAPESTRPSSP
ncbi:MAG: PAS domain S-box protein [Pirellulales bacterium]|nr:PAS domain S-box protein [Pirellulales bacterium]